MRITKRKTARGGLVAGAMVGVIALGSAGAAWAASLWEPGGYNPTSKCDVAYGVGPNWYFGDYTKPAIVSGSISKITVIGNSPKTAAIARFRATDGCSGVRQIAVFYNYLGSSGVISGIAPTDTSHDYTYALTSSWSNPSSLGKFVYSTILAQDRFDTFQLTNFNTLSNSTTRTGSDQVKYLATTQRFANQPSFLLRQTKVAVVKNKTALKKGQVVTITGTYTVANGSTFVALGTQKVTLQRKIAGTTSWVSIKSVVSTSAGKAIFSDKPLKSAYYRLVYTGKFSSPWNAPITSGSTAKVAVS